ncbi:MAG: cell division protein FtsQ [Puniceicoccaceae bacterium 5H]|nr:MAG: cell division protein FtsQ [Puniceicoccaceae bacterium 5H]
MPRKSKTQSKSAASSEASHWRSLQTQKAKRKVRPQTRQARQRRWLKGLRVTALATLSLLLVGGLAWSVWFANDNWEVLSTPRPESQLQEIQVTTDGVLTRDWIIGHLELSAEPNPLELDLFALKQQLESQPQIASAELRLELPGTLHVDVLEREPVLRMRTRWPDGSTGVALIARDGTVYEGYNYSRERLMRLPGAVGIRLVSTGPGRYEPIQGVDVVADLLEVAAHRAPELSQDWKLISFERFDGDVNAPDALITIYGRYVHEWVFSPAEDFPSQLAAARQLYRQAKSSRLSTLAQVDVSFPDHAFVRAQ